MEVQRGQPCGVRVARVRREEHGSSVGVELVVDREVGQVEERVAHAGVLPVDDDQPLAVVDEVRVEQIVVAGTRRLVGAQRRDPPCEVVRFGERRGKDRSALDGGIAIRPDNLEGVEPPGYRRPVMEGTERRGDPAELLRLAERLGRGDRPVDEAGHEPALRLDEVHDLGADAGCRGGAGRGQLDRPVDPEQIGVLPRDAQDEHAVGARHLDVVVGDPAAEHLPGRPAVGPDPGDRGGERVAHAWALPHADRGTFPRGLRSTCERHCHQAYRCHRPRSSLQQSVAWMSRRRSVMRGSAPRPGRRAAPRRRPRPPTRRRSRPRRRSRRRARLGDRRTRSTRRRCSRSHRS